MTSLSIPDVNVWLALASHDHVHSERARLWWRDHTGVIAMIRSTQHGLLRLTTTSSAMNGKPLTLDGAWRVHDRFYDDDRVTFLSEPTDVEKSFRKAATGKSASPKLWADAWLLAFAHAAGGELVTLDKALAARGAICLLSSAN
jgi:toxin-antitoxin system PIN domain toxin